jgi:hypothetical protein
MEVTSCGIISVGHEIEKPTSLPNFSSKNVTFSSRLPEILKITAHSNLLIVALRSIASNSPRSFACAVFTNASLENNRFFLILLSVSPCFLDSGVVFINDTWS